MGYDQFYVTFGAEHIFGDAYLMIYAMDEQHAREMLFGSFDVNWCTLYTEEEWLNPELKLYEKLRNIGAFFPKEERERIRAIAYQHNRN